MKGDTSPTQCYFGQEEVDANLGGSGMTWMNLKPEGQLGNVFYAVRSVIGTHIVPLSGLAELLHVVEAHVDVEEEGEEQTSFKL